MSAFFKAGTDRQRMFNEQEAAATRSAIAGGQAFAGAVEGVSQSLQRGRQLDQQQSIIDQKQSLTDQKQRDEAVNESIKTGMPVSEIMRLRAEETPQGIRDGIMNVYRQQSKLTKEADLKEQMRLFELKTREMIGIKGRIAPLEQAELRKQIIPYMKGAGWDEKKQESVLGYLMFRDLGPAAKQFFDVESAGRKETLERTAFRKRRDNVLASLDLEGLQLELGKTRADFDLEEEPNRQLIAESGFDKALMQSKYEYEKLARWLKYAHEIDGKKMEIDMNKLDMELARQHVYKQPEILRQLIAADLAKATEGWEIEKKTKLGNLAMALYQRDVQMRMQERNQITSSMSDLATQLQQMTDPLSTEDERNYLIRQGEEEGAFKSSVREAYNDTRQQLAVLRSQLSLLDFFSVTPSKFLMDIADATEKGQLDSYVKKYDISEAIWGRTLKELGWTQVDDPALQGAADEVSGERVKGKSQEPQPDSREQKRNILDIADNATSFKNQVTPR